MRRDNYNWLLIAGGVYLGYTGAFGKQLQDSLQGILRPLVGGITGNVGGGAGQGERAAAAVAQASGAAGVSPPAMTGLDLVIAWQNARTLAGENPYDWDALKAHLYAIGVPEPDASIYTWQGAQMATGGDPTAVFDWAAARAHVIAIGAPDPGATPWKGFH